LSESIQPIGNLGIKKTSAFTYVDCLFRSHRPHSRPDHYGHQGHKAVNPVHSTNNKTIKQKLTTIRSRDYKDQANQLLFHGAVGNFLTTSAKMVVLATFLQTREEDGVSVLLEVFLHLIFFLIKITNN
jgi:hypothetical protein